MSINKVCLTGNLTRDAELKALPGGTPVLGFGLAVNDRRKNPQTDEWEDYPNFVDCTMFGARAERLAQYLKKGGKVALEGKLHYSSWESKDGQKRSKLEVVVSDLEFMSPRDGSQGQQGAAQEPHQRHAAQAPAPAPAAPQTAAQAVQVVQQVSPGSRVVPNGDVYDQDIPF